MPPLQCRPKNGYGLLVALAMRRRARGGRCRGPGSSYQAEMAEGLDGPPRSARADGGDSPLAAVCDASKHLKMKLLRPAPRDKAAYMGLRLTRALRPRCLFQAAFK